MKCLIRSLFLCALLGTVIRADAAVTVTVDPSQTWNGYMNVFELEENGGAYLWGSSWGTADLNAGFSGDVVTLAPNSSISRDVPLTDAYWWKPDGAGNKWMEANFYVEDSTILPGEEVTFEYEVLGNSLVDPYWSMAFIKDFAPDYSWFNMIAYSLHPGVHSFSLPTEPDPGRHVQYGFMTMGPNARLDQMQTLGFARVKGVQPIPEPSTLALIATSSLGLLSLRRNRKR